MAKRRFRTQYARDLHWALKSPSLMDHPKVVAPKWGQKETARWRGVIRRLDRPGSALWKAVRRADIGGPGEYFELLVRTWIEEVPPARLKASNWQVYAGEHTVGEFDLLFERDRTVWHWELAAKFYLGRPADDGQFRWFGPLGVDRLDRKWAKMRGQQLRLAGHHAASGSLGVLDIEEPPESRALIKGYLFEPMDPKMDPEMPPDINPNASMGWWARRSRLDERAARIEQFTGVDPHQLQWMVLPKKRWLSPAYVTEQDRLVGFDQLAGVLEGRDVMLVAGIAETKRGLREITRGFVVQEDGRW